jgi:hypothetical protein
VAEDDFATETDAGDRSRVPPLALIDIVADAEPDTLLRIASILTLANRPPERLCWRPLEGDLVQVSISLRVASGDVPKIVRRLTQYWGIRRLLVFAGGLRSVYVEGLLEAVEAAGVPDVAHCRMNTPTSP